MALPVLSFAQPKMGAWPHATDSNGHNFYINYVGGRVLINSPANIAGSIIHTIANDWGKAIKDITNPIGDVEIVKADPYEACGVLTNGSAINGKIALIKRGNCEFGAKALAAQNAGAVAVIIVNHSPGPPVGMGAGALGSQVNIPVIMVSDVDGAAIEAALGNGAVKMTMTVWGNGFNNDIGFVDRGLSLWHSYSVPLNQLQGSTVQPFKGFDGAVLANFGTTTAATVKVKVTVSWTPTGGSKTVVRTDSMTINGFAAADSIATPFIDGGYDLTATTTGVYDVEYEAIPNFNDQFLGDNKARYSIYVDNRIYSKGRYDFTNNRPFSGASYRLGTGTTEWTWGTFMYMTKPDYAFENVKVALSSGNATDNSMSGFSPVQILVYKWVDNGDSIIAGSELVMVGYGQKSFTTGDTSGQVHTVTITDPVVTTKQTVTEANTWYWVAAAMPTGAYLNVDGVSNYFVRSWGRSHATAKVREPYAPLYPDNFSGIATATNPLQHFPFETYFFLEDSIRFSQQNNGLLPSLPVQMSLFKVGVNEVLEAKDFDISLYPNPATDVVNISLNLEKEAKEVYYTLMSITGSRISTVKHTNVKKDTYSIATEELPAGSYMVIMSIDGKNAMRQFSVMK